MQLNKFLLFVVITCGQVLAMHAAAISSTAAGASTSSTSLIATAQDVLVIDQNRVSQRFNISPYTKMRDIKKEILGIVDEKSKFDDIRLYNSNKTYSDDDLVDASTQGVSFIRLGGAVFKTPAVTTIAS